MAVWGLAAAASPTASSTATPEIQELERFRMPFDALVDRTIGKAARPIGFDWRATTAHAHLAAVHDLRDQVEARQSHVDRFDQLQDRRVVW